MKSIIPDKSLVDLLNANYAIDVLDIQFLDLGADLNASVCKVDSSTKQSYFVKITTQQNQGLLAVLNLFNKVGIEQIIQPIQTLQDHPLVQMDDFNIIVYPFIEGQDGFHQSLNDHQWRDLGTTLKKIHQMDVPLILQHKIRRESYSPQWRNAVRAMLSQEQENHVDDGYANALWAFVQKNMNSIHQLVNHAEQLSLVLEHNPMDFVLCHSDIHGGNILIDHAGQLFIVDWDSPIMAPKERDLMFIGGGVGNIWNNPEEEKLFYEGYGATEVNKTALAYYRHERIVEDIAEYFQEILFKTAKSEDKQVMYGHFIGMFEPRGVVEIALETDDV